MNGSRIEIDGMVVMKTLMCNSEYTGANDYRYHLMLSFQASRFLITSAARMPFDTAYQVSTFSLVSKHRGEE